jgi:hypothetical protein
MKGTYKRPHTSLENMKTCSTTSKLDCMEDELKKIQDNIASFNKKLDNSMDDKLFETH